MANTSRSRLIKRNASRSSSGGYGRNGEYKGYSQKAKTPTRPTKLERLPSGLVKRQYRANNDDRVTPSSLGGANASSLESNRRVLKPISSRFPGLLGPMRQSLLSFRFGDKSE